MAIPTSRQELVDYVLRKLGAPVLEVNVAAEQIDDLVDDAIQLFQERHFDGVYQTFLKYKVTADDIARGRSRGGNNAVGIVTTTGTAPASSGISTTAVDFNFEENSNYIQVPTHVIGVNKLFLFEGTNSIASGMFSIKYQLFLNDIYYFSSVELLTYAMTKTYLEDLDFLLTTQKQIRFNKRQDRLYLDVDWSALTEGQYIIIDCWRQLNPADYAEVWNDSFLKKYVTALVKKQWGQNLIKFQGVSLPGGVQLNGRQLYDDGQREIDAIMEQMSNTYELPPLDMIG